MFQGGNFVTMCMTFHSKVKICLISLIHTLMCHLCCRQKGRLVEPWSGQTSRPHLGGGMPRRFSKPHVVGDRELIS